MSFNSQAISHVGENAVPAPVCALPKQAKCRIPWAGLALQHPPPIRNVLQRDPRWTTKCSGQMGDSRVARNHQVQLRDHSRSVQQSVRTLVEIAFEGFYTHAGRQCC